MESPPFDELDTQPLQEYSASYYLLVFVRDDTPEDRWPPSAVRSGGCRFPVRNRRNDCRGMPTSTATLPCDAGEVKGQAGAFPRSAPSRSGRAGWVLSYRGRSAPQSGQKTKAR